MATAGAVPASAASKADVLFLFDTTGSMSGALEGAKQEMLSVQDRIRAEIPDAGSCPAAASAAAARKAMKVAVVAQGNRYSLDAPVEAGLVDVIQRDKDEVVLVTDDSTPVTVAVSGTKVSATLRSLSGEKEGAARTFGPATGTLTVKGAKVMRGKKALKVNRDRRGPRTTVRVARKGRGAVLQVKARDATGVAATMVTVGGRKAKLVRRGRVRIARLGAKGVGVRHQSLDVLGNRETVRTLRLRR